MEPDMPDKCERTLTTFLKCVADIQTKISKSNFDLRGLERKCRCAATMETIKVSEGQMDAAGFLRKKLIAYTTG